MIVFLERENVFHLPALSSATYLEYILMTETTNEAVSEVTEQSQTAETEVTAKAKTNIISVQNPTAEEMTAITANIKADYNFHVDVKPVDFNFKKRKDTNTGIETIRETVQLAVPYVSVQGLVAIIEGKHLEEGAANKGLELLLEAMETVVNNAARDILSDGPESLALTAATFPVDKLSWEFIANLPKAQRKGGGIPKETWDAFVLDYIAVMPIATGKTLEQVGAAAKILQNKFGTCKTNFDVLSLLVEQLAVYADASENAADFEDCLGFLLTKADTLLNVTQEELLAAL